MDIRNGRRSGLLALAAALVLGGAAVAVALSGSGSHPSSAGGGLPAASTATASPLPGQLFPSVACDSATAAGQAWPDPALAGLPRLAGATVTTVQRGGGTLAVPFTVPSHFTDAAGALRAALPGAGFVVVGGDEEPKEVDTRFLGGTLTGGIKLIATGSCTSLGILAVVDPQATAAPASPLPASLLPGGPGSPGGQPFASAGATP